MNGKGNVILPATEMAPLKAWRGYLAAARYLFSGAKVLARTENTAEIACSFLCAQTLECLLKAYLDKRGISEKKLRERSCRHNLNILWEMANANGLGLSTIAPHWCNSLNDNHDEPYIFRYMTKTNGLGISPVSTTVHELGIIFDHVEAMVKR